jgi:hypothetical protein
MKSRGFKGPRPSPVQEIGVIHFHRLLAKYMGTGAPQPGGLNMLGRLIAYVLVAFIFAAPSVA